MSKENQNNEPANPMELGKRERQVLSFVYRRGRATAAEVLDGIEDPPSYSGVRALLRILEEKGHLIHERNGARYVFMPSVPVEDIGQSAMDYTVSAFFSGSAEKAVAALLSSKESSFSAPELNRLAKLIKDAQESGR